jgi:hypothetical protein
MSQDYLKNKICPICSQKVGQSEYLNEIFANEPEVNYLAHLVTHYRHNHIDSWNRCWGYQGWRYRGNWFVDYDEEKRKVNERAKRQIIRKGRVILNELGIKPEHFARLQNTEEKTMEVANKLLISNESSKLTCPVIADLL